MQIQSLQKSALKHPNLPVAQILGFLHEHMQTICLCLAVVMITVLCLVGIDRTGDIGAILICLSALTVLSTPFQYYVIRPLIKACKKKSVDHVSVVFFRSFQTAESRVARDWIAPILGCHGRLRTIDNPGYREGHISVDGHSHDTDSLTTWLIMAHALTHGEEQITFSDNTWQSGAMEMIRSADLVIVDMSHPSGHIEWELSQSLSALPANRVIRIADVAKQTPEPGSSIVSYELTAAGRRKFRRDLHRAIAAIGHEATLRLVPA